MAYGKPLAKALGCAFVSFDFDRSTLALSATDIRQAPFERWGDISAPARELYVRRLCIAGPESTGKSTVAAKLASALSTIHVPEYAKTLIASNDGAFSADDAMRAALGQIRSEKSALAATGPLMVLDSDPLTTLAWTLTLFGSAPPELEALCRAYPKPDATLLFDPHLPWSADIHRQIDPQSGSDASRMAFFQLSQNILARFGRDFEVATGGHAERHAQALALSQRLIAQGPRGPAPLWEPSAPSPLATKAPGL
jgi:NadR type nicotinamide-nucleotide adenylyltransferase